MVIFNPPCCPYSQIPQADLYYLLSNLIHKWQQQIQFAYTEMYAYCQTFVQRESCHKWTCFTWNYFHMSPSKTIILKTHFVQHINYNLMLYLNTTSDHNWYKCNSCRCVGLFTFFPLSFRYSAARPVDTSVQSPSKSAGTVSDIVSLKCLYKVTIIIIAHFCKGRFKCFM